MCGAFQNTKWFIWEKNRSRTGVGVGYVCLEHEISRDIEEQSYLFHAMETYWLWSIKAMSQNFCALVQLLKVSAPHRPNFLNITKTFNLLSAFFAYSKQQFSDEKTWYIDVIRERFDQKLANFFQRAQIYIEETYYIYLICAYHKLN